MQKLYYNICAWVLVTIVHLISIFLLMFISNTPKFKQELILELVDINNLTGKSNNINNNRQNKSINNDNQHKLQPSKPVQKKIEKKPRERMLSADDPNSQFHTIENSDKVKPTNKKTDNNHHHKITADAAVTASGKNNALEIQSNSNNIIKNNLNTKMINQQPDYNKKSKPPYPLQARRMGVEGTVILGVNISETGSVENIRIVRSSGSPELDRSALNTYKKEKFIPRIENNIPKKSYIEFGVNFRLED
ncbi:MAG: TonB family protein [Neisseriaceae bacterium]|nr:MAG: TonB family protein [Neisseriaceae bacterium]